MLIWSRCWIWPYSVESISVAGAIITLSSGARRMALGGRLTPLLRRPTVRHAPIKMVPHFQAETRLGMSVCTSCSRDMELQTLARYTLVFCNASRILSGSSRYSVSSPSSSLHMSHIAPTSAQQRRSLQWLEPCTQTETPPRGPLRTAAS